MATKVYETKKVTLFNGKELELRPLKISVLRDFMTRFDDLQGVSDDSAKSLDVIIDCVQIAMRQYAPELSDNREALEDEVDLPTAYKIIEVGSGIKLDDDDPNL